MRPTPVAGAHAPSSLAPPAEPACPYVGPEPFQQKDAAKFFGRDVESVDLMYSVLAHAEVLFYAQSGAGKTSLINAKLVPLLKEKECKVLPVARVKGPMNLRDPSQIKNLFVFNVLARWTGEPVSPALAEMTLKEYLVNFAKDMDCDQENPPLMVAIFDQFEELLTAYPERWQEREPFFLQVREASSHSPCSGSFSPCARTMWRRWILTFCSSGKAADQVPSREVAAPRPPSRLSSSRWKAQDVSSRPALPST